MIILYRVTFRTHCFCKSNGLKPLTIFVKGFISHVWLVFEYTSVIRVQVHDFLQPTVIIQSDVLWFQIKSKISHTQTIIYFYLFTQFVCLYWQKSPVEVEKVKLKGKICANLKIVCWKKNILLLSELYTCWKCVKKLHYRCLAGS